MNENFKILINILILSFLFSCQNKIENNNEVKLSKKDTILIHDTILIKNDRDGEWQKDFGLSHDPTKDSIWKKPVSFYIEDAECNPIAYEFYFGYIRPSDNGATTELLKLACTDNKKLRPFYRWCLNKTLIVSDGALAELVGVPARKYAEKYPDEFFEYLDVEKDNKKYEMWTEAIQYSGFFDYPEFNDIDILIKEHYYRMSKNLKDKSEKNLKRIQKFTKDCQTL